MDVNDEENEDEFSFTWTPPTEAELKVLQAKRERNDKISSIMGKYLLKGYKMLATSCPICDVSMKNDFLSVSFK